MDWLSRDLGPVRAAQETCQVCPVLGVLWSADHECVSLCPLPLTSCVAPSLSMYHVDLSPHAVLRCLGLPARSVTNFNSAHDTHFNRAIDKYFTEDGEEVSSGDSIWSVVTVVTSC